MKLTTTQVFTMCSKYSNKVCKSVFLCMLPRLGMRQNSLIVNLTNKMMSLSHTVWLEFESMYQPDVNKLFSSIPLYYGDNYIVR